jgi:hypothetical protein
MSQGVCWVTIRVSRSFLIQRWWLRVFSSQNFNLRLLLFGSRWMSQAFFPCQNWCLRVIFRLNVDVSGYFLVEIWCLRVFSGWKWWIRSFSGSKLISQGILRLKFDVSGCFVGKNWCLRVISGWYVMSDDLFVGQHWCLRVFSESKFMSQGIFRMRFDVSRCFVGHNCCIKVFSGSKVVYREVCWVKIVVSGQFLIHRLLTSQGVFWVKIEVSGCFPVEIWCRRLFSESKNSVSR